MRPAGGETVAGREGGVIVALTFGCSSDPASHPSSAASGGFADRYLRRGDGAAEPVAPRFAIPGFEPPAIGIGGSHKAVRFGGSITPDMVFSLEGGVGYGRFGASTTVLTFSLNDSTLVFFPDPHIDLSAELGPNQARSGGFRRTGTLGSSSSETRS